LFEESVGMIKRGKLLSSKAKDFFLNKKQTKTNIFTVMGAEPEFKFLKISLLI